MSCTRLWAAAPLGRLRVSSSARGSGLKASTWASCRVQPTTCGLLPRFMSASSTPGADADAAALRSLLHVSDEVAEAIASDKPVVALESTIYTHGFMGKGLAREHVDLVRRHGGIPAIIAIVDGVPKVGVSPDEIVRMIEDEGTVKVSRRDVAYLVGMGLAGRKIHGGTTISGTMLLARLAGIRVFGTGGLGGVHRGGENSMDVSADLTELGRTRVAVIAAGCKGFLDIPRTLEYLETQGCLVSTFADGRAGRVDFPAFWVRDSGIKSPSVVQTEREAAAIILAQERLNIESGMFFANPVPEKDALPAADMAEAIEQAITDANDRGYTGSNNTPFVLGRLKELMGGRTVVSNMGLVQSNIVRATNVAVELSSMLSPAWQPAAPRSNAHTITSKPATTSAVAPETQADILVAGSVAIDLSCDYAGRQQGDLTPQPDTSNPASITQSIGGVGHNVALAAHRASSRARVKLCSLVGDDLAGSTIISSMESSGLDTTFIRRLGADHKPISRTAQYVAVNDGNKNLVMAMADMGIFSDHSFPEYWKSTVQTTKPKWLVVDGNWEEKDIKSWIDAGKSQGASVAFEPVSMEKSRRVFGQYRGQPPLGVFPQASLDLASPNTYELAAMYGAARENGYLDTMDWFQVIDALGMRGARERFVYLTSAELTDAGVPVQSIQLLPYIPTIVTKLGSKGVLLTALLRRDDPRLFDRASQEFILARSVEEGTEVGGVYMRLFPSTQNVEDIVSVNGVGDTLLGVLVSGLAQGGRIEKLIDTAQRGAVMTLRSADSVSADLNQLKLELSQVLS